MAQPGPEEPVGDTGIDQPTVEPTHSGDPGFGGALTEDGTAGPGTGGETTGLAAAARQGDLDRGEGEAAADDASAAHT